MIPFPCPSLFQQLFCRLTSVTSDLSRCDGDPGPFTIWATALPEPLATTEGPSTEPNLPIMDVTKKRSKRRWEPGGAHICYSTGGKFQNPHPSDLSMTDQDRGMIQSPTSKTSSSYLIIAYSLRKNQRDCFQWQRNSWTRSKRKRAKGLAQICSVETPHNGGEKDRDCGPVDDITGPGSVARQSVYERFLSKLGKRDMYTQAFFIALPNLVEST